MRFHFSNAFVPTDQVIELARVADGLGYHGVHVSDHLFFPQQLQSKYPYSKAEDGSPIWGPDTDWPDTWCLVSAMAAVTERLTFTSSVYIAPARDLVTVAKLVGTAAVISRNRVRLGLGAGWCREEFDATGQRFDDRGKRLDDMIPALRALWGGGWVEHHGPHYDVPAMQMNPAPTAPVPIYGSGLTDVAMRRSARLCDGWVSGPAATLDETWDHLRRMREHLRAAGREEDDFAMAMGVPAMPEPDLCAQLEEAGLTDLTCAPWFLVKGGGFDAPLERKIEGLELFADRYLG